MKTQQSHSPGKAGLVYRQTLATRITHAIWAVCLFFLLLTGLQIFNAHPALYLGRQSGFEFPNTVMEIGAREVGGEPRGFMRMLGREFDTTGFLGFSGGQQRAFPPALTIPSSQDLATGRVIHFFFAWVFVATLIVWLAAALWSGHARRDIVPGKTDIAALPADVRDHLRFALHHRNSYGPLQKLSYFAVLFILFPMMIATGLAMSPGANAVLPFLADLLGGRQSARTLHFGFMLLLLLFFLVHIVMIMAAGPFNELRSIITGWYRTDRETEPDSSSKGEGI